MNVDEIVQKLPVDQIAQQLGVDPDKAREAIGLAVPAIVGGMQANAQDPGGEKSLAEALGQHDDDLADGVLDGNDSIDRVDTDDGDKIVGHIFGENRDQVVNQLSGASGLGGGLMGKLLPMLAPLVMSYIAKRLLGGGGGGNVAAQSGGMGSILGQILGGSGRGGSHGGGLADVLGQVLGGGAPQQQRQSGGIDIGSILGGLLGAGRK